jgi:UDP-N-acetylmuramyl pentapeptide phosphotransferase/UDP-N-acetylglucosamine-1-phosphate transferase
MPAVVALAAFAVCWAVLLLLLARFRHVALDRPNERSLHERPVPRTGGLAILAGGAVSLAFGASQLALPLTIAALLAAISFFDDLYGLQTSLRLAGHVIGAAVLVWYVLSPMGALELVLLALAVAWLTNLYNFMDGSDGLAGGMSVLGFGCYALAGWWTGETAIAALCAAIAAAAAAFLLYNFHPARIFLGDVGSIPLGFLAGSIGIVGWRNDAWPLWFPVLVFGPFIGDATLTLVKRAIRGERVWRAHREHYYQRMIRMGLGHRVTALIAYAIMAACAGAALFGRDKDGATQALVFGGMILVLGAVAAWVDLRWARTYRGGGAPA